MVFKKEKCNIQTYQFMSKETHSKRHLTKQLAITYGDIKNRISTYHNFTINHPVCFYPQQHWQKLRS